MSRVLLLLPTTSYKSAEFLDAARRLEVGVVVGTDRRQALAPEAGPTTLALDFAAESVPDEVARLHRDSPFGAVLGVDDETVLVAARIAAALGLPHNPPGAVAAAGDKGRLRAAQHATGLPAPAFRVWPVDADPGEVAAASPYPCVLKPTRMSGSRGVIRANDPAALVAAFGRVRRLLERAGAGAPVEMLVEDYLPGEELTVEAVLRDGRPIPLALFDKPDPLDGPYFAETLYVSPARVPAGVAEGAVAAVAAACTALGLRTGPVHAEVRLPPDGPPVVLEAAPRTIGGRCGRALRFPGGRSLAEVVLAAALDSSGPAPEAAHGPTGVLMLPVPRPGILRAVRGLDAARAVPGVRAVEITIGAGQEVEPLPEGGRYLGFVFADGESPDEVESALRSAGGRLEVDIEAPAQDLAEL